MKIPIFGYNKLQSFLEFVTNTTRLKFGLEDGTLFVEKDEVKTNLFNVATGDLTAPNLYTTNGVIGSTYTNKVVRITPLITTTFGTVVIEESGDGRNMTTKLTLTDFIIGTMPGSATAKGIGAKVCSFPAGAHIEESSYLKLALTAPGTAVAANCGIGSVVASGVISVLTGTATFIDRQATTAITTGVSGGTPVESMKNTTAGIQTGIAANVEASVKDVFLNAAGTWNVNNGSGNLTATGIIVIKWTKMSA